MADAKVTSLSALTAITGDDVLYVVDDPGGTPASKKATAAVLRDYTNMVYSAYSTDAALAAAVNTLYVADISGFTAERTLTLPGTAAVGDRVGLFISTGDDAYEFLITATAGDTLNGVAGGTEWSRLFITNELVVMRCTVANTTWIVEYDGRIPMKAMMSAASAQTGIVSGTETTVTKGASGSWSEDINIGNILDTANNAIKVRRACKALFIGNFPFESLNDQVQCYAAARVNSGTARRFVRGATSNAGTNVWSGSGTVPLSLAADDSVTMRVLHTHGTDRTSEWVTGASMAFLGLMEILP